MPRKTLSIAAVILLLGFGAFVFRSWLEARDDRLRLQATLDAQSQILAAAEKRERERAAELKDTLAQIAATKRATQTPSQIVRALSQSLPLPQPIELPATEPGSAGKGSLQQGSALPEKPAARIPLEDLKPLFDFVQDCRACRAELAAARSDLSDERTRSAALTRERDAALNASRGGAAWTRFKRNAKWLAIGAGIGVVLGRAAR